MQQRQGDVILAGQLSAAQDINVGASSAVLSVIAKSYQATEFTWPSLCEELAKSIPSTLQRPTVILVAATRLHPQLQAFLGSQPVAAATVATLLGTFDEGALVTAFRNAADPEGAFELVHACGARALRVWTRAAPCALNACPVPHCCAAFECVVLCVLVLCSHARRVQECRRGGG
ncbi:hypothetical protein EON66_11065 [archaeon]|nr:MAG: hypothetical protein EON66_11065 [archaeon]